MIRLRMRQLYIACLVAVLFSGCARLAYSQTPSLELADRSVAVGDAEIHYMIGGSGPPLLLIHGFMFAGRAWGPFIDDLGEHYTLVIPDLRGHGNSTPFEDWSYEQAARDMFAVLDDAAFDQAVVIGYSAGANTAIHMALQDSRRLSAMVLVAGAHRLTTEVRETLRNYPPIEQMPTVQLQENRGYHPGGDTQIRRLLAQLRSLADNFDDFDISPEHLGRIAIPTMSVVGDRDDAYPLHVVMELHEAVPNSTLWVLPNESHLFLASDAFGGSPEAREAFVPTVLRFLQAQGL